MGTKLIRAAIVCAVLAVAIGSGEASACSWRRLPEVADLEPGRALPNDHPDKIVVGVYEFESIARFPRLLVYGPRDVTVVTRYWGEPPARLGLEVGGSEPGIRSYSDCGDGTSSVGTQLYWYADELSLAENRWGRGTATLTGTEVGLSRSDEALLEERFGAPQVLSISLTDRLLAHAMIWRWHGIIFFTSFAAWLVVNRHMRRVLRL